MLTGEYIGRDGIWEYGCVCCQIWHDETEAVYQEHIMSQSKHGMRRRPLVPFGERANVKEERA